MRTKEQKEQALENYQIMVNSLLGDGVVQIDVKQEPSLIAFTMNGREGDFCVFKTNFKNRIKNLFNKFCDTASFNDFCSKVKDIAYEKTWRGAYGELAAYECMALSDYYMPIKLDDQSDAALSFARECGKHLSDADGYVEDADTYFDVKILADVVDEILKNVVEKSIQNAGLDNKCHIDVEYPQESTEDEYRPLINQLVRELSDYLNASKSGKNNGKRACFNSQIKEDVTYRILWGAGVNSALNCYNPYKHAEEQSDILIKRYAYKFRKDKPFFLVMVNFPWYNQLVSGFADCNKAFYRSLARRTFMLHRYDMKPMSSLVPGFTGSETIYDVSKKLSGIIFIEDKIIDSKNDDKFGVYVYLNPNADNLCGHSFKEMLQHLGGMPSNYEVDDFEYDNY